MKLAAITTALLSMGALAAPSPTAQEFQFSDLQWTVETSPGHTITFNGTIEALTAQLQQQQQAETTATTTTKTVEITNTAPDADTVTDEASTVTRRTVDFSGGNFFCGGPWPYAYMAAYWEGLDYLRSIMGQVRVPPGPRMCSRVSCSYDAAVWICNDRTDELHLNAFADIADGVSYIISRCATNAWGARQVAGQVFHPDHWNVIVRRDDC
ncbi:predicted protein [Chaetomium globosum CBS 148.51]|uniref:Uncharacterized protein n=1 Tax=Chaetomium globosum (strain ATCC 6205 / CBS 148.51 / DSM 1962 / NBRC 6347 / NRRL 1970) TaxID=306901 RepID=Q2GUE1_CHAGB|nr:uncharacterized protein CHGG_08413 [Chaetomium globosum CBS 148.51]EAQ84399.1 predicted protein [Chaetomium globosum CBS 148.51]